MPPNQKKKKKKTKQNKTKNKTKTKKKNKKKTKKTNKQTNKQTNNQNNQNNTPALSSIRGSVGWASSTNTSPVWPCRTSERTRPNKSDCGNNEPDSTSLQSFGLQSPTTQLVSSPPLPWVQRLSGI